MNEYDMLTARELYALYWLAKRQRRVYTTSVLSEHLLLRTNRNTLLTAREVRAKTLRYAQGYREEGNKRSALRHHETLRLWRKNFPLKALP